MNTTRTPLFYMANLGSEFSRILSEYQRGDFEKIQDSIIRAENIMGKIEEFPEMKGRTGELEILRSIIKDLSERKLEINKEQLMDYFTPFAIRQMSLPL